MATSKRIFCISIIEIGSTKNAPGKNAPRKIAPMEIWPPQEKSPPPPENVNFRLML